jgi:TolB protein
MRRIIRHLCATCLLLVAVVARAQLTIEITADGENQIPVAVLRFAGEDALPTRISEIIEADLLRSGRLRTQHAVGVDPPPTEPSQVNFGDWKSRNADAIVIGGVQRLPDGRFEARVRLLDVPKQTQLVGVAYTFNAEQVRAAAHRIADVLYAKLTDEAGIFSTHIAYVVKQDGRFELRVADADGQGAQVVLSSREPIISPSWSPEGTRLAYVSFESMKPVIYVHSLTTGQRHVLANFRGSNSAPAWSPDGRQLAAVLSKEGGSQIYLINADGSNVRRITESVSIDTEPFFSVDGQFIYFTSDRGGSPQIYRMPAGGGEAALITSDGGYNVSPRLGRDGKTMAFITLREGRFQLAIMDLESRQMQVLTDTQRDESPSFAPDGSLILYATQVGGRGVLAALSAAGGVKQRLSVPAADVREPAWGPFLGN